MAVLSAILMFTIMEHFKNLIYIITYLHNYYSFYSTLLSTHYSTFSPLITETEKLIISSICDANLMRIYMVLP